MCFKYSSILFKVDDASRATASELFTMRDPDDTSVDGADRSMFNMSTLMGYAAEDLDGASFLAVKVSPNCLVSFFFWCIREHLSTLIFGDMDLRNENVLLLSAFE